MSFSAPSNTEPFKFYDQNMEKALLALGFDARGVTVDERSLDPVLLRSWIRKLRGICTHPQVGQMQNHADKKGKPMSIEEVLEVSSDFSSPCLAFDLTIFEQGMRENNWKSFMEERRNRVGTLSFCG